MRRTGGVACAKTTGGPALRDGRWRDRLRVCVEAATTAKRNSGVEYVMRSGGGETWRVLNGVMRQTCAWQLC